MKQLKNIGLFSVIIFMVHYEANSQVSIFETQTKAINGDVIAQFEMGKKYLDSLRNLPLFQKKSTASALLKESREWFIMATKQGHMKSRYCLYLLQTPDYECPIDCIKAVAIEGVADAQYTLGGSYLKENNGTPKDLALAYKWLLLSQEGHADGDNRPGLITTKDLINDFKISHLDIGKGQKLAKEHTEKFGTSVCIFKHY